MPPRSPLADALLDQVVNHSAKGDRYYAPEEEYLNSLSPVDALKMRTEIANARKYTPAEASANQWQTIKDIAYATPIVGNVLSAMDVPGYFGETKDAAAKGDMDAARKSMIMTELSAIGAIPFLPFGGMERAVKGAGSSTRIFAGPMAKTADRKALSLAEDLASRGASRDEIWQQIPL